MKPFGKTSRGSSINDIRKKMINLSTLFPHVYNRPNWGYLLPVPTMDSGHPNFNLINHPPSSNYPFSISSKFNLHIVDIFRTAWSFVIKF